MTRAGLPILTYLMRQDRPLNTPGAAKAAPHELGRCDAACMGREGAALERRHALPTCRTTYPRSKAGASAERHIFVEGREKFGALRGPGVRDRPSA